MKIGTGIWLPSRPGSVSASVAGGGGGATGYGEDFVWYGPDDAVTVDQEFASVVDQSGNSNDLSLVSGTDKAWKRADLGGTGKAYMEFDGSGSTGAYHKASFMTNRKQFALMFAWYPYSGANLGNQDLFVVFGSTASQPIQIRHDTNNNRFESYATWASGNVEIGTAITEGQMAITGLRLNVDGVATGFRGYHDSKTAFATENASADNGVSGTAEAFGIMYQRIREFDMGEVRLWLSDPTDAVWEAAMDEMATRWGVTLS